MLPAAVRYFVGRAPELRTLTSLLDQPEGPPGTVLISAIGGMAGVGKTALAVRWAHQVASRFPDGQLYVDLRGFGPSGGPVTPEQAVRGFLEALQVAPERIPADAEAQVGLYRSLLAGRRILIVLDNARDEEQVRPLLPASPTCLVVVTSRRQLTGLVISEGACPLTLDVFSQSEAEELLTCRLGAQWIAADPKAAVGVIGSCARLPLALSVAAARAAASPGLELTDLAAGLRDERDRLDVLEGGDTATSIRAVFSWSYQQLTPAAARIFRLLGLHPAAEITTSAAASLTSTAPGPARQYLRELTRAHLLSEHTPGRFTLHDLLRAYAAEQAQACESSQAQRAALTALFDYYLAGASAAMDVLVPAERHRRPDIPAEAVRALSPGTPAAAHAWLDAELPTLVAVAAHTSVHGWPGHTTRLAAILFRYLYSEAHYSDALIVYTHAVDAARRTGDRAAQAYALVSLSGIDFRQGRCQQASDQLQQALTLARHADDRLGQALALTHLGVLWPYAGSCSQATDYQRHALRLFRDLGDHLGEGRTLNSLGLTLSSLGHYQQAVQHVRHALQLFQDLGHRSDEAMTLDTLGIVLSQLGRHQEAASLLRQALSMFRDTGNRAAQAETLDNLGVVSRQQGAFQQAVEHHEQALAMYRDIGDRPGETEALNGLGEALHTADRPERARDAHRHALTIASQTGDRYGQARAHDGLARTYHATGHDDQLRHHRQLALTLYTALGVPEAELDLPSQHGEILLKGGISDGRDAQEVR